jgi:hypothetical protein
VVMVVGMQGVVHMLCSYGSAGWGGHTHAYGLWLQCRGAATSRVVMQFTMGHVTGSVCC